MTENDVRRTAFRRAQIGMVAIGSTGTLLLLGGLASGSLALARLGAFIFAISLVAVFVLGICGAFLTRSAEGNRSRGNTNRGER